MGLQRGDDAPPSGGDTTSTMAATVRVPRSARRTGARVAGGAMALAALAGTAGCTRAAYGFDLRPGAGGRGSVAHLSGWLDEAPDGARPSFRVTVDGREITRARALGGTREGWRILGRRTEHRFDASVPLAPGPHEICIHPGAAAPDPAATSPICRAINVPAGGTGTQPPAPAPEASPRTTRPAPPPTATRPAPGVPAPVPTPAPAPSPAPAGWQAEMLASVNAARAGAGAPPLAACANLDRAAQAYAAVLASQAGLSHTGPDGSKPLGRARAAGYSFADGARNLAVGENIAKGYPDVAAVMKGWLDSPGHRANILNATTTHIGVGRSGTAWVQEFGSGGTC